MKVPGTKLLILIAVLFYSITVKAQDTIPEKERVNKKRLMYVAAGSGLLYGGAMITLYHFWYSDYPMTSFHLFNDNNEWMQVDKTGHGFTSYYESIYGYKMLRWAGFDEKKSTIYGGAFGFLLQTPIEILDGFSSGWGFSMGDLAANTAGSALFIAQQLKWKEQIVQVKFSYTPSKYATLNPDLLGSSFAESIIKDYNGQTYWLSAPLQKIAGIEKIPAWLNLAVGYGADGMLRGTDHDQINDARFNMYQRQRQFYLSLDVNLLKIQTGNKFLNNIIHTLAFIKIPAPAIVYLSKERKFKGIPFYF